MWILGDTELHFTLSSLDTHLGGIIASFGFSCGGRQKARLSFSFPWNALKWGHQLDMTIFTTCKLILQQSLGMKSIQREDIKPEGQDFPLVDSAIYLVSFPVLSGPSLLLVDYFLSVCMCMYVHICVYMH